MAVVVLLAVSAGSDQAQAQRRNRNHWTTDADIGRGEGPVDDQALRDAYQPAWRRVLLRISDGGGTFSALYTVR